MAEREEVDLFFGAPDVEGSEHPDAERFEVGSLAEGEDSRVPREPSQAPSGSATGDRQSRALVASPSASEGDA